MSPSVSDISVITINWNGRHHLEHLLPSVAETGPGEIILVDNGSEDDSIEWVRLNFPDVRVIQNQVNRGFAEPNNVAAEAARGRYLAFINNDMRCHPEWLSQGLQALESADCVASRILDWDGRRIDFNGSSLQYLGYAAQKDIGAIVESVRSDDAALFPCGGSMLIDRRLFLDLGGFDPEFFAIYEDVDLGWRIWLSGHQVRFCKESVCYHRGHGTFRAHHTSKMRYLMHRNALMTIIKNYDDENLRRILPAALVMAIRRAIRLSGVQKESFYLWSTTEQRVAGGDQLVEVELEDAFNHLVAVDDVLSHLPALMTRRKSVQQLRQRSDQEILKLFGDPLRAIVEDPDYIRSESDLLEILGLDLLFDVKAYRATADNLIDREPERLRRVRDELRQLQWSGIQAIKHPPDIPRSSRLRIFFDIWKTEGPVKAFKKVGEAVRRAV